MADQYITVSTCDAKHESIVRELDEIKKGIEELRRLLNPKLETILIDSGRINIIDSWINKANQDKKAKSEANWKLIAIIISLTGGMQGIIEIIKYIAKG